MTTFLRFMNAKRIIIVACGTSWHAGLVGEYIFEDLASIPVEVEYASEFRYRNPIITPKDIVIAISHSLVKPPIPWLLLNWQNLKGRLFLASVMSLGHQLLEKPMPVPIPTQVQRLV